jgi:putative chitinase
MLASEMPESLLQDESDWVIRYRSHRKVSPDSIIPQIHESVDYSKKIDWTNPNCRISPNFTVIEVTKNDPRRNPMGKPDIIENILILANELEKIRKEWGTPIGVTSWYRPPAVNQEVGGARNSMHLTGLAADIYPINGDGMEFESWLMTAWEGGLGYGQRRGLGFTHVDLGEYARWNY